MPPGSGQKGTGKKNSAAMQKQSRNSTPVPAPASALPPQEFYDPDYLDTRVILFANLTFDNLVDQSASSAPVPDSRSVDAMLDKLKTLINIMEKRSTFYDRGMRYLADERKKRPEDMRIDVRDQDTKKSKHKRKKGSDTLAPGDGSHQGTFI
jgi:transcriptional adapter 3